MDARSMACRSLDVVPARWFSWDLRVQDAGCEVARIDMSFTREKAELSVSGLSYRARREGVMRGAFLLEAQDSVLAQAEKTSVFLRSFDVRFEGRTFTLQAVSAMRREFALLEQGGVVGRIAPRAWYTRRAVAQLPEDLPMPFRAWLVWLVMVMWKRAEDSAATHGAS